MTIGLPIKEENINNKSQKKSENKGYERLSKLLSPESSSKVTDLSDFDKQAEEQSKVEVSKQGSQKEEIINKAQETAFREVPLKQQYVSKSRYAVGDAVQNATLRRESKKAKDYKELYEEAKANSDKIAMEKADELYKKEEGIGIEDRARIIKENLERQERKDKRVEKEGKEKETHRKFVREKSLRAEEEKKAERARKEALKVVKGGRITEVEQRLANLNSRNSQGRKLSPDEQKELKELTSEYADIKRAREESTQKVIEMTKTRVESLKNKLKNLASNDNKTNEDYQEIDRLDKDLKKEEKKEEADELVKETKTQDQKRIDAFLELSKQRDLTDDEQKRFNLLITKEARIELAERWEEKAENIKEYERGKALEARKARPLISGAPIRLKLATEKAIRNEATLKTQAKRARAFADAASTHMGESRIF